MMVSGLAFLALEHADVSNVGLHTLFMNGFVVGAGLPTIVIIRLSEAVIRMRDRAMSARVALASTRYLVSIHAHITVNQARGGTGKNQDTTLAHPSNLSKDRPSENARQQY